MLKMTDFEFTLVRLGLCLFVSGTLVTSCLELLMLGPATIETTTRGQNVKGTGECGGGPGTRGGDLTSPV